MFIYKKNSYNLLQKNGRRSAPVQIKPLSVAVVLFRPRDLSVFFRAHACDLLEHSGKIQLVAETAHLRYLVYFIVVYIFAEQQFLREAYARDAASPLGSVKAKREKSMDNLFMDRFLKLIDESYTDPDFSIEKGSEKLGLSRVHLYRKVKELAGVTPTDFLRNYRLKKAAALLRRKSGNVNEVAYATGFSSPAYFSKCFKAVYNITPTEYLEKEQKSSL